MAVNQSALLDMAGALKSADGGELMRRMLAKILQELIDAEATSVIGAGHARAVRRPHDAAQRCPREAADDQCR